MNLQSLLKTIGYKGEFVWAVMVMALRVSETTSLCRLSKVYFNALVSVDASLLVCYPELTGVGYSGILLILVL